MNRSDLLTCAQVSKAQLFELAHLDRRGRLRHLPTLDAESLRQHLAVCADCRRWYENALRALDNPPPPGERDTPVSEGDTTQTPPQC